MGNERAYNYLKRYSRRYNIENLKKKLINSGYSRKDVEEAALALKKTSSVKMRPIKKPVVLNKKIQNKNPSNNKKTSTSEKVKFNTNKKVHFNIGKINSKQEISNNKIKSSSPMDSSKKNKISSTGTKGNNSPTGMNGNKKNIISKTPTINSSQKNISNSGKQVSSPNLEQVPKSNSKKLIWIISIAIAVILIGGGIAAYFLLLK